MSTEILDDFRPEEKSYHAKKSFRYFLITIALFAQLLFFTALKYYIDGIEFLVGLSGFIALTGFGFSISGFWSGVKSIFRKEPSFKKYIGTFGNSIFVAILLLLLYANFLDILRFANS